MGGHSAWRKRVARGELAIQSGGAIARHRPRWGRKGEDLKLNRKGNIAGGNPKKIKKKKKDNQQEDGEENMLVEQGMAANKGPLQILIIATVAITGLSLLAILRYVLMR